MKSFIYVAHLGEYGSSSLLSDKLKGWISFSCNPSFTSSIPSVLLMGLIKLYCISETLQCVLFLEEKLSAYWKLILHGFVFNSSILKEWSLKAAQAKTTIAGPSENTGFPTFMHAAV